MEKSLPNYYDHAETILNAIPKAVAIACDISGNVVWFESVPIERYCSIWVGDNDYGERQQFLGKFNCPDWKASLIIKKVERWEPKSECKYYYIAADICVEYRYKTDNSVDDRLIKVGNCFKTRQQAEDKLVLIKEVLNG